MKRTVLGFLLVTGMVSLLFAQQGKIRADQMTRVAVVNYNQIYDEFKIEAKAQKELNDYVAKVQEEINQRQKEIEDITQELENAREKNETAQIKRLEGDQKKKGLALQDYVAKNNTEIAERRKKLSQSQSQSDSFEKELLAIVAKIAQTSGYSMIVDSSQTIWFSPNLNITNEVLRQLRTARGR